MSSPNNVPGEKKSGKSETWALGEDLFLKSAGDENRAKYGWGVQTLGIAKSHLGTKQNQPLGRKSVVTTFLRAPKSRRSRRWSPNYPSLNQKLGDVCTTRGSKKRNRSFSGVLGDAGKRE